MCAGRPADKIKLSAATAAPPTHVKKSKPLVKAVTAYAGPVNKVKPYSDAVTAYRIAEERGCTRGKL